MNVKELSDVLAVTPNSFIVKVNDDGVYFNIDVKDIIVDLKNREVLI